jgi:hypothetical protein
MPMSYTVTTFPEQATYIDAFMKKGGLRLFFLVGDPGCSKSWMIRSMVRIGQHVYVKVGRLTALQLYKLLYRYRHKTIILDDVEDALKRDDTRKLLMMVCETDDKDRLVGWLGTESLLVTKKGKKSVRIPQEFTTRSRVCIVSNNWDILSGKFGPLLDRGLVVFCDHSNQEIHRHVGTWFKDTDIYNFIGNHLDDIGLHSIRFYTGSSELKSQGLDWKAALLESWTNEQKSRNVAEEAIKKVMADPTYKNDKDRVEAFQKECGLKRRMFYYYKLKLGM